MEPPISVPMPRHEPLKPIRAPSPPEEPPAVNVLLNGFVVTLKYPSETGVIPFTDMYCTQT
jgi:hypothetical protein